MDTGELDQLRRLRNLETLELKPSQYLRTHFPDSDGEMRPVILREYQKKHIMEMCQVPRHINGCDTGLGKTLMVLSSIGYIWLKEPSYYPIVVTTKSALFQWESECRKFMQNMTAIPVSGEPHERNKIYEQFFRPNDEKKLLIITYDSIFRDLDSAVVKDKAHKASSEDKKALKVARQLEKDLKETHDVLSSAVKDITDSRSFEEMEYVFARNNGKTVKWPPNWNKKDEEALVSLLEARAALAKARAEVTRLSDLVSPPMRTSGIMELIQELKSQIPEAKFLLALDEVHKVKNYRSQVHEKIKLLSNQCDRIIGMTATPVKNRLMEFFGIFRIVNPSLFPKVVNFQNEYCVTKLQRVPGGRQVPIIVGYKNLDNFVSKVEPYFLARKKQDVAKELPELISVEVQCELNDLQDELYDMAETGVGNTTDEDDYSDVLSSLVMCQQAVDSPNLILDEEGNPFEGPSSKLDSLIELLENDADGQKVIVFSRFEKMISVIEAQLKKSKIEYVRITGKETDPKYRQAAREKFQDTKSNVNVILITMAGSESLNLQAAEHFVFIDLPWSYGDYLQLIGRMIRIGSSHKTVVAHHFLGKRKNGTTTIDHHVLKALQSKKKLSDKVSGDSLKDGLKLDSQDAVQDILEAIRKGNSPSKPVAKPKKATLPKKKIDLKDESVPVAKKDSEIASYDLSDI